MLLGVRWGSMRLKIIAWSFVPTAIILVAVALVTFVAYQQVTQDLVIERDKDLTRLAASQLTAELSEYAGILASFGRRTPDIYRGDPALQLAALKRATSELVVFDGGVLVLNNFGLVVAAEPARPDLLGQNWSDRPYFQQLIRSSEPVFSNIRPDGWQGINVVSVAIPITDEQGEFRGALVGLFRLGEITISPFYGSIVKLRVGNGGPTYLVDDTGRVIYHPDVSLIGSDLSDQPVVQQVLTNKSNAIRTRDVDGRDIVAGFAPVPGTPWGLITEESWSNLLQTSRRYQQFLLFLLALGIIVPALVVIAGVRRLTQPITDLIDAAQAVAGGNFGQTITVETGDELEDLAHQFNLMSAQLQASYASLERRVADRTKALETLNAIAAVVSQSLNLTEILQDALDKTLEITIMEAGGAFRLTGDDQTLRFMAHRSLSDDLANYLARFPLAAGTAEAAYEGHPVVRRINSYPPGEWRSLLARDGWQLVVSIPLMSKGNILGAMNLFTHEMSYPSPEELALLSAIGQQIGVAVENARYYEQAQRLAAAEERQRLARDLHDSVTQALYGVTLYAEAAGRLLAAGQVEMVAEHLAEMQETAKEALREVRLLIFELRPPVLEREGLVAALRARLEAVEGRSGLDTVFEVEGINGHQRLPLELETGLYRIAQEALNNTLKHAQAKHVTICLNYTEAADRVVLEISDDGLGFDPQSAYGKGRVGLSSMAERAAILGGLLTVESHPGTGTKIRVEVK